MRIMKGQAAVFTHMGKPMEIREYNLPEVEPGAILVKIGMANICGSDTHFLRGKGPGIIQGVPQVMGHEMMGKVHALGAGIKADSAGEKLSEGDRVAYAYYVPCGTCPACLNGVAGCPNRYRYWLGANCDEPPHFTGAFAQYYYLRPGQWVFKVPDDLPDHLVSPVNCALSEVIYGFNQVGITLGDAVVIQGAGGLGLYAIAVAREMGAGVVIVIEKRKDRLQMAKDFGADHIIDAGETDMKERVARVKEMTKGGGADLVAEFTGIPEILQEGIEMLRFGGRYLVIGNINLGTRSTIDPGQVVRGTRTLYGVITYGRWVIPRALAFLQRTKHKYPYERIISHKFKLSEINQALEAAYQGKGMRISITP
jgi:threonine dehydrogenase-like Zn-dependent dehydrogenase